MVDFPSGSVVTTTTTRAGGGACQPPRRFQSRHARLSIRTSSSYELEVSEYAHVYVCVRVCARNLPTGFSSNNRRTVSPGEFLRKGKPLRTVVNFDAAKYVYTSYSVQLGTRLLSLLDVLYVRTHAQYHNVDRGGLSRTWYATWEKTKKNGSEVGKKGRHTRLCVPSEPER